MGIYNKISLRDQADLAEEMALAELRRATDLAAALMSEGYDGDTAADLADRCDTIDDARALARLWRVRPGDLASRASAPRPAAQPAILARGEGGEVTALVVVTTTTGDRDLGTARVPGSTGGTYQIGWRLIGVGEVLAWGCACPDHERRGGACKHLAAAKAAVLALSGREGVVRGGAVAVQMAPRRRPSRR
jgi:hypothetical protein